MRSPRRVAWRALAVALVLLLGLVANLPPAVGIHSGTATDVASEISETVTLARNRFSGYTFTIARGDRLTYDVRVIAGTGIDLYIVPASGFVDYRNDSAPRFDLHVREEDRTNISGVFVGDSRTSGADTVILDNADVSGAMSTGPVTISVHLKKEPPQGPSPALVGALVAAVAVGIGAVALLLVRARRKARGPPPPAAPPPSWRPAGPYAPPYPPPPPPPQGPFPPRP